MNELTDMCCVDCINTNKNRTFCFEYGQKLSDAIRKCKIDGFEYRQTAEVADRIERIERAVDMCMELMKNGATVEEAVCNPAVLAVLQETESKT